ncbi:MAG: hypothetical protein KIT51_07815 [Cyclobacteriaceae bacterium]|nr:MAG: hypothetical protein KIT51_07815 [Cyclobacteriaceae bacterium]
MSLEENIRKIVAEEIQKAGKQSDLVPLAEFCKEKNLSRVTVWRAEKQGKMKLTRIGKKVFVSPQQFINA